MGHWNFALKCHKCIRSYFDNEYEVLNISGIDYTGLFDWLKKEDLKSWSDVLSKSLPLNLNVSRWGDLPFWQSSLDELPTIKGTKYNVDSTVSINCKKNITTSEIEKIESCLMNLHPWRKGPFSLFNIQIDSEWRSNLKWLYFSGKNLKRPTPHSTTRKSKIRRLNHNIKQGRRCCQNGFVADVEMFAFVIAHTPPRLFHNQTACSHIPRFQIAFPKSVKHPFGNQTQIQCRCTGTSNRARFGHQLGKNLKLRKRFLRLRLF